MRALVIPPGLRWQLIVCVNACTDDTASIAQAHTGPLPLRVIDEPRAGLSRARNAVIAAANPDTTHFVFTDDDVIPDSGWLAAYAAAFARFPEAALFAGAVVPQYEQTPPGWFQANAGRFGALLAARDFGPEPMPLTVEGDRVPYGANCAWRADVQRAYLYDERVGPGTRYAGEETDVAKAMLNAGHSGWWLPDCRVTHMISPGRTTRAFVLGHARLHGRTSGFIDGPGTGPWVFGAPAWSWRRTAVAAARYGLARLGGAAAAVPALEAYGFARGQWEFFRANQPRPPVRLPSGLGRRA